MGQLGVEAVAETGMRVDEAPVGHRPLELAAQFAHVHVDRAVARAQLAAPHGSVELIAPNDRAGPPGHLHQQLELAYRQRQRLPRGEHETLARADLQFSRMQNLGAISVLTDGEARPHLPPRCELRPRRDGDREASFSVDVSGDVRREELATEPGAGV